MPYHLSRSILVGPIRETMVPTFLAMSASADVPYMYVCRSAPLRLNSADALFSMFSFHFAAPPKPEQATHPDKYL